MLTAAALKLLILAFYSNTDGWELLLLFLNITTSPLLPPWPLYYDDKSCQANLCVMLFFSYRCCWCQKQNDTIRGRLCLNSSPEESGWKTVNPVVVTDRSDRRGRLLKLLSRQFGERRASSCQHVAVRQRWLSECKITATPQLLGTFTQIRCD